MAPIDIGFDSNNFNNNNAYAYGSRYSYYNGESESGGFGKAVLGFVVIAWNKGLPGAEFLAVVVMCTVLLTCSMLCWCKAHSTVLLPFSSGE